MALEQLIIRDWGLGLVTDPDTQDLPEQACAVLENFHVSFPGKLIGRGPFRQARHQPSGTYFPALTGVGSFQDGHVFTTDKPSSQEVYLMCVGMIAFPGNSELWMYPRPNAGAWDTTQWETQPVDGGPVASASDYCDFVVRRGDIRAFASYDPTSVFGSAWSGYIARNWFNNNYSPAGDYYATTTILDVYPGIGSVTAASAANTTQADHKFPVGYYTVHDITMIYDGYEESLPGDQLLTYANGASVRIPVSLVQGTPDQRLTGMSIYRSSANTVYPMPSKRLLYQADINDGYLLDGLRTIYARLDADARKASTTGGGTWLRNEATWFYYSEGWQTGGQLPGTDNYAVRCGNQATSAGATAFYVGWTPTATVDTNCYVVESLNTTNWAIVATAAGTIEVTGDATAVVVGTRTIAQETGACRTAARIASAVFNAGPVTTTLTLADGAPGTAFTVSIRITPYVLQTGTSFTARSCVIGYPFSAAGHSGAYAEHYTSTDFNQPGKKIKVWGVDKEEDYDLYTIVPPSGSENDEVYVWFTKTTGYDYPSGASAAYSLRVPWQYSGTTGYLYVWDHNQDISGNPTMDAATGVVGGRGTTADAQGCYAALVGDRLFLGDVYQGGERIRDGVLYCTFQGAGLGHDVFDPLNLIVFGGGDSGKVKALVEFQNQLYVFKDHDVFLASVDTANVDRIVANRFPDGRGLQSSRSVVKSSGAIYYLSWDGFRRISSRGSELISNDIRMTIRPIADAYRKAARGAFDPKNGDVWWLVQTGTTTYKVFIFERETTWTTYTLSVTNGASQSIHMVNHPTEPPFLVIMDTGPNTATFMQRNLDAAAIIELGTLTYKVKTHHLLAQLNADTLIRQVYWRGLNNGTAGTLKVYTEGQLSASFVIPSSASIQDLVFQLQVDRSAGSYASHLGAYHELEFTSTALAAPPEVHHMGLSYTRSARSRMAA